jgi:hypothetical protein
MTHRAKTAYCLVAGIASAIGWSLSAPALAESLDLYNAKVPLAASSRPSLTDEVLRESIFIDEDWYTWCGSTIRGDDGLFHMFYSRWRHDTGDVALFNGFNGWVKHSEIAHATSTSPHGPFVPQGTVLSGSGGNNWDAATIHNPHIKRFGDQYYLYYMGNKDGNYPQYDDWGDYRNAQRIGVAVASSLNGPWTRFDAPLLSPQPGTAAHIMVNNPSVTQGPNGTYLMMFKTQPNDTNPSANTVHAIATSNSPLGPFTIGTQQILTQYRAEDPYVWFDSTDARYYAVIKDWDGGYSGTSGGIAMITSTNGTSWSPAQHPLVSLRTLVWDDTQTTTLNNLERPQLLFDASGKPSMLFAAASVGNPSTPGVNTFNVHIPFQFSSSPGMAGDVNLDGLIRGDGYGSPSTDDIAAFLAGWQKVLPTDDVQTRWRKGDLDLNWVTNLRDIYILRQAFIDSGQEFNAGAFASVFGVPEPHSLVLVAWAACFCSQRRTRANLRIG